MDIAKFDALYTALARVLADHEALSVSGVHCLLSLATITGMQVGIGKAELLKATEGYYQNALDVQLLADIGQIDIH